MMSDVSQDGVPPGFEAVSLIEALNGPTQPHCAPVVNADGTLRSLQLSDTAAHHGLIPTHLPTVIAARIIVML